MRQIAGSGSRHDERCSPDHHPAKTQVLPAPDPWVPLIVGGKSDAALRRAATLGDGWTAVFTSPGRCAESIARIAEHAENVGREDVAWRHSLELWCGFGPTVEDGRARLAPAMERFYGLPFDALERYIQDGLKAWTQFLCAPCGVAATSYDQT